MAKRFEELEVIFKAEYPNSGRILPTPKKELKEEPPKELREEAPKEPKEELPKELKEELPKELKEGLPKEPKEEPFRKGKRLLSLGSIIFYLAIIVLSGCAFLFSHGMQDLQFYEIPTDSMQSEYSKGSLVIARETNPRELAVADDIVYLSKDGNHIIQRITKIEENYEDTNERAFITSSINKEEGAEEIVLVDAVFGKVIAEIPILGTVVNFVVGNIILTLGAFLLFAIVVISIKAVRRKRLKVVMLMICLLGGMSNLGRQEVVASSEGYQVAEYVMEPSEGESFGVTMEWGASLEDSSEGPSDWEVFEDEKFEEGIDGEGAKGDGASDEKQSVTVAPTVAPTTAPTIASTVAPTPTIIQEPEGNDASSYEDNEKNQPEKVNQVDVGRGFAVLVAGMAIVKITFMLQRFISK